MHINRFVFNFFAGLLVMLTIVSAGNAATGVFGSYVGLDENGGGNVFYGAQQPGPNMLTIFDGLDLGTFDLTNGDSLVLSGGELLTFKNGGGDVTGAEIQWRVNRVTASAADGTFAAIGFGFGANATFTDAAGNSHSGGGDQRWDGSSAVDVIGGLAGTAAAPVDYELEVFFRAFTNEGDRFSNNGGINFTALFNVVPEPCSSTLIGMGIGLLMLCRRR